MEGISLDKQSRAEMIRKEERRISTRNIAARVPWEQALGSTL